MDRKDEQASSICRKQKCQLHLGNREKTAKNGKQLLRSQVTYATLIKVPRLFRTLDLGGRSLLHYLRKSWSWDFPKIHPQAQGYTSSLTVSRDHQSIKMLQTLKGKTYGIIRPEKPE